MGKTNQTIINQILASLVTAASIAAPAIATAKVAPTPKAPAVPRGRDIEAIAGSCNIGSFPQTTKVGRYNQLCDQMSDAEKCLAFLKQHFDTAGGTKTTGDDAKLDYCLTELDEVLAVPLPPTP